MNGRGGVVTTASFAGPYGTVPVRVVAAFNPRRSEYLVVWFAWRPGSVRELLAQRLDARGRAIGDRLKIAPLPPGIPSIVALDASTSSGGYMISWSVDREGWMRLVDPDRPSSHAPRKVFDTSQWDAGYTAVAATNARAGTSAHAWTQGNGDSDGPKVYVRVVARKHH
jgi:hypothetical protein